VGLSFSSLDTPKEAAGMRVDFRQVPKGSEFGGDNPRVAAFKHDGNADSTKSFNSEKRTRPSTIGIFALVAEVEPDLVKQAATKWRILEPDYDFSDSESSVCAGDSPRAAKMKRL